MNQKSKAARRLCLFTPLLLLFFIGLPISGQIKVTITPPKLKPGMLQIESMVSEQVGLAAGLVEIALNKAINKPLVMQGLADSSVVAGWLPGLVCLPGNRVVGISIGAFAGAQSDSWDGAILQYRLDNIKASDDFPMGVNLQPFTLQAGVSLNALVPGLGIHGGAGWLNATVDVLTFEAWYAEGGLDWRIGAAADRTQALAWDGVLFNLGVSYGSNRLSATIVTKPIVQNFPLDPDGDGPLLPLDVAVQITPNVAVALDSWAFSVPVSVSTGISLLNTIDLQLGAGLAFATGLTGLSLNGTQTIEVQGFLAKLQETPGTLSLSGQTKGAIPQAVYGQIFGSLRFRAGPLSLTIPLLYRFGGGISAGAVVGVSL